MTPDIRKTVDVPLTPAQTFDLFTAKLDTWWPSATHSVSAANDDTPISVKIEPRKGGKITEKLRDGTSATWGTVTHWAPGNRIDINWVCWARRVRRHPSHCNVHPHRYRHTR